MAKAGSRNCERIKSGSVELGNQQSTGKETRRDEKKMNKHFQLLKIRENQVVSSTKKSFHSKYLEH